VRGVAVDPSGNIILFGLFYGSLDFGAGLLTSPSTSVFLLKTDPSGTMLWSKSFPTSGNQSIHVTTDAAGNLLMTGQGVTDFGGGPISTGVYIAKLDPSGAHVWSKQFGAGHDEGVAIAAYDTKNILVTGRLQGTIDFGGGPLSSVGMNDVFLAKLRLP
jgi:hypothetical protein